MQSPFNNMVTDLTLDTLMLGSKHFKRRPAASRLMPYQIKGEVVKINTVPRQLCFPLEYREGSILLCLRESIPTCF